MRSPPAVWMVRSQTARAMTQVTGVAFVTVENDDSQAVNIRQSLVAFQALVNIMNPLQPVGIEHRMDSSQGVGTEGRLYRATLPEAGPADLFPSVDAANLAQNNTRCDFTTAAVEMRGFSLRSETSMTMSLES